MIYLPRTTSVSISPLSPQYSSLTFASHFHPILFPGPLFFTPHPPFASRTAPSQLPSLCLMLVTSHHFLRIMRCIPAPPFPHTQQVALHTRHCTPRASPHPSSGPMHRRTMHR